MSNNHHKPRTVARDAVSVLLAFLMMLSLCTVAQVSLNASAAEDSTAASSASSRIENTFNSDSIYGVEATYYDYLSDYEISNGYLNRDPNRNDEPFNNYLNKALSDYASYKGWTNPLYFGNFYGAKEGYNGFTNFHHIINNSNGLTDFSHSIQGLASGTLTGGQLKTPEGYSMPMFDRQWLKESNSKGRELAKVYDSYFPFVYNTDSNGVTTYSFDSSGGGSKANSDNVYFTWNGTTPTAVNYGKGASYAVADGGAEFELKDKEATTGYGIFPFDTSGTVTVDSNEIWLKYSGSSLAIHAWNSSGSSGSAPIALSKNSYGYYVIGSDYTSKYTSFLLAPNAGSWDGQTGDLTLSTYKGKAYDLTLSNGSATFANGTTTITNTKYPNYGFGIRLDMDFRVPAGGKTADGKDVVFEYSGDDDLWVYITDENGNGSLVLDMGGDHKMSSGTINFNTMTSTVDHVDTVTQTFTGTSGQILIKKTSDKGTTYNSMYLKRWNSGSDTYIQGTQVTLNGETFYQFYTTNLGGATEFTLNTAQTDASQICYVGNASAADGNVYEIHEASTNRNSAGVVPYTKTTSGSSTTTVNGGVQLDPKKTYHMTVFYMERGLIESNFRINFTMTPVKNEVAVDKSVVMDGINNDTLKAAINKDTFNYTVKDSSGADIADGKTYTYVTDSSSSKVAGTSPAFSLKDNEAAIFSDKFTLGTAMTVTESELAAHTGSYTLADRYSTSWVLKGGTADVTGSTTAAEFTLGSADSKEDQSRTLSFTNTVKTGSVELKKVVYDRTGADVSATTDKTFTYKVTIDVNNTGTYDSYPLNYTLNDAEALYSSENGEITFSPKDTVKIAGIPAGAKVKVEEINNTGYTGTPSGATEQTITGGATATFTVTNSEDKGNLKITKAVQDEKGNAVTDSQEEFTFNVTVDGVSTFTYDVLDKSGNVTSANQTSTGAITFKANQEVLVKNLPANAICTVTETVPQNYTCTPSSGTVTRTIAKDSTVTAAFTNKKDSGSLKITKTLKDSGGTVITGTDKSFDFTVTVGDTASLTELTYTVNGGSEQTMSNGGTVPIKPGDEVLFIYLPAGAEYNVTESVPAGYTCTYENATGNIVKDTEITASFTNQEQNGSGSVTVNKTLDSKNYTGKQFTFTLEGLDASAVAKGVDMTGKTTTANNVQNGVVTFTAGDALTFSREGVYRYKVYEGDCDVIGVNTDSSVYYVQFEVTLNAEGSLVINESTVKYYSDEEFILEESGITFANTTETAKITVKKSDQGGGDMSGTEFALIKVTASGELDAEQLKSIISSAKGNENVKIQSVAGGEAVFDTLSIYQDGSQVYNPATNTWENSANYLQGQAVPQRYCLFEYSAIEGYSPNSTVNYVTFPITDNDGNYIMSGGNYKFDVEFSYVDGLLLVPDSGFTGTRGFMYAGIAIAGLGLMLGGAYVIYTAKQRKKQGRRFVK